MTECLGKKKVQFKKIPLSEVGKGINYCRCNALNYLEDARIILQAMRPEHAYASIHLAIEELGKIILFKEHAEEACKNYTADEISIDLEEWRDHKLKTEKAWKILDPTLKMQILHKKTRWDMSDTKASHPTRMECTYVDFVKGKWELGPVFDYAILEALINNVEKVLKSDVVTGTVLSGLQH